MSLHIRSASDADDAGLWRRRSHRRSRVADALAGGPHPAPPGIHRRFAGSASHRRCVPPRLLSDPSRKTAPTAARATSRRHDGPRPKLSGGGALARALSRRALVRRTVHVDRGQRAQEPGATVATACEMPHRLIGPDHAADGAEVGGARPRHHGSLSSSSSIRPREAAQRLTSCRELSCSLRNTAPTWDSTVRALMLSRIAMRL